MTKSNTKKQHKLTLDINIFIRFQYINKNDNNFYAIIYVKSLDKQRVDIIHFIMIPFFIPNNCEK